MGGDARVAVVQLAAVLADRPDALALLRTLLVALGQPDAAAAVSPTFQRAASRHGYDGTAKPVRG